MSVVEAHGRKFKVSVTGISEKSESFIGFLNNFRQNLLALPPASVAALHQTGAAQERANIASPLDRMTELAARTTVLSDRGVITVIPASNGRRWS